MFFVSTHMEVNMEKISSIVRGNARVTTADSKAAAARTGMPSFGRPEGESTPAVAKTSSTASRAVALHNGIVEAKRAMSQERVVSKMADDFFMSKSRPGEIPVEDMLAMPMPDKIAATTDQLIVTAETQGESVEAPAKEYVPRGSFVDVRA